MNINKIREFFKDDTFAVLLGISIDEVTQDKTVCSMKISANHRNAKNGAHGGVIYSIADFAFAVASNSKGKLTVTLDSNITYLSQASDDILIATATLINQTRHTCHYNVQVTDGNGTLVANVVMNGYIKNVEINFD